MSKVTPISKAYELHNHLRKKAQERQKKKKPPFTRPPDDAG